MTRLYLQEGHRATCSDWGTYFYRYKNEAGKTCHEKLGRSNEVTLKDARDAARILKADIQQGADPQSEARKKKETLTWTAFFDQHYLPHAKQHKRSWKKQSGCGASHAKSSWTRVPI